MVTTIPRGLATLAVRSFLALCSVVDALVGLIHGQTNADILERLIHGHLRAYQNAYGALGRVPKHHYSLHLPNQLRKHGMLQSLFVHERRHKAVKRWVHDRRPTVSFERG